MCYNILFLTNSELGQASVCLAVAHEFLLQPGYKVHIASFAPLHDAIPQLNTRAVAFLSRAESITSARKATFHTIAGLSMRQTLQQKHNFDASNVFGGLHGVGFHAASQAYKAVLLRTVAPWSGPEYMAIYHEIVRIVSGVEPDVVVLDPLFPQAVDACRALGKEYVVLSPNTFKEHAQQPHLGNLWKYPMVCSGYPYPLPWWLILPNTILAFRLLSTMKSSPGLKELEKYRNDNGLPGPIPDMIISPYKKLIAVLLPGRKECEFPCFVPKKFTFCGPILRPCAPIADEHPDLAHWISQRPTVLVNLGSIALFTPAMEREFAETLKMLFVARSDIQVLWKLSCPLSESQDSMDPEVSRILSSVIAEGRLRTERWLPVEPICILQSGHVECIVHHGGSNTYYEAVRAGVPQIILPIWFDTYDFAHRVEYLEIGIWGNRQHVPEVQGHELGEALRRVLSTEGGLSMKQRAREIASKLADKEGRVLACEKIREWLEAKITGWRFSFGIGRPRITRPYH